MDKTLHPFAPAHARMAPERAKDAGEVERLIDRAFGPGRYAKSVERLREQTRPCASLSRTAWLKDELVGTVRLWPIRIGDARAVLLGPIAVKQGFRGLGLGAQLVEDACAAASKSGERLVLLVGDTPFFGPLGFAMAPARVILPGPVDRRRLLLRELVEGAAEGLRGRILAA